MAEFVIITGLSGAGRSQAGATLEDLGWFVVDNLPTALIVSFAELATDPEASRWERVVLVVGRDTEQLDDLVQAIDELRRRGISVRTLFLDATDEVLVHRFEGTRRRHPLGRDKVLEAIALERQRLAPIRHSADVVIDTSDLNIHQLRGRLIDLFLGSDERMQISVTSFGFKYGVPLDVDNVFDVRFLPNPHWVEELKYMTGIDEPVRAYVLEQPEAVEFVERVEDLLGFLLPAYLREGRSYLSVAVGCTGGRHRSVAIAEDIAMRIRKGGYRVAVFHRDITR